MFSAAFVMSSCSDFLDTEPDQRVDIDNEDKVVKLLVSAYPAANYALLSELSSDNAVGISLLGGKKYGLKARYGFTTK